MIITLKGADFSASNIGTLSTAAIIKVIGRGLTHNIPNFVEKGTAVNWVINTTTDYEFGECSITMGGVAITPDIVDGVMTISIPEVTGAISVSVASVYVGVEIEPDEPEIPAQQASVTFNVKSIPTGTQFAYPSQYDQDCIHITTGYWMSATANDWTPTGGIYKLNTFPFNNGEYTSACIDLTAAKATGFTKLEITAGANSSTTTSMFYVRRSSANMTDWTIGTETTRNVYSGAINISDWDSIVIGLRKHTPADGKSIHYYGETITLKFS